MKTLELYFQNVNFDQTFEENSTKLAEFKNSEDLKKNYLNYFSNENPLSDWEIKDFDSMVKEIDKNDNIILAINRLALELFVLTNDNKMKNNPLINIIKSAEILPMMLCVRHI